MAAEKSKNAAYERLRKAIKEHSPARAYLFYGEESYLRQTYVQQLQELLIPKGSEIHFSAPDYAKFLYFTYPADWQAQ